MKFKGLAAAIAATVIVVLPSLASAQGVGATRRESSTMSTQDEASTRAAKGAPAAKQPTKEQFAKGAKDGPPLVAASGVTCTIDQIYWVGSGKDAATKQEFNAYETTCKEGLGYLITTNATPTPTSFDCVALSNQAQHCILPGNAHPELGMAAKARAAGRACDATKAVYNGSTRDGQSFYELACSNGPGFELGIKGTQVEINECIALAGTPRACKLTAPEQIIAALAPAVTASGKTCALKDQRFIGAAQDASGDQFYEVSCQTGPGFVLVLDKALTFRRALDCRQAEGLAGGCKMTDSAVIETQDNAIYSRMAAKAGFPCQVSKYRFVGVDKDKREAVELACSDRPDGAFAFLSETVKTDVYDCVRAGTIGQTCKLTTTDPLFAKYQKDLSMKGKSCNVTGIGFLAKTATADFVELACAEPPGWTISYPTGSNTPGEVLSCPQIAGRGLRCKLPSNAAK